MQTTPHGLSYPDPTDSIQQGDDVIKALAQALDPAAASLTLTPATNWTIQSAKALRVGPLVFLSVACTRANSVVGTATTAGELTDVQIFSGLPTEYRPASAMLVNADRAAFQAGWGEVRTDGTGWFTHGVPSAQYPVGAYVVRGFWMLGV